MYFRARATVVAAVSPYDMYMYPSQKIRPSYYDYSVTSRVAESMPAMKIE